MATANSGLITDIIACPGLDYCALANARSIIVAQHISKRFASLERQRDIGELKIKISGCINACGHHHVGHIGILGVEKKGAELYQITLGGSGDEHTSIGEIIGRGFGPDEIIDAVETIVDTYLGAATRPRREIPRRLSPRRRGAVQGGALWGRSQSCLTPAPSASDQAPTASKRRYGHLSAAGRDRGMRSIEDFAGGIAAVSSFGADSAVLLHMIAQVDRSLPVLFLDTGKHFGETLDYRDALAADLGLTDVRVITPAAGSPRPRRSRRQAAHDATPTPAATSARSSRWHAPSSRSAPG